MASASGQDASSEPAIAVPEVVAHAVALRWPERGAAWCAVVEDELVELCSRYNARPRRLLGARFGFVVAVEVEGEGPLVMRSTADPDGAIQARAAQRLASLGVGPVVHEVVNSPASTWTIMDRVLPGQPAPSARLDEFVDLLAPLAADQRPASDLMRISDWLRNRLAHRADDDIAPDTTLAAPAERENALAILDDLGSGESWSLCHGDLSSGNVLRGQRKLMLVDPRGTCGDAEYDAAVLAMKTGCDCRSLAKRLALDLARTEAWSRVADAARV